jgi:hypothetical protein
MGLLNLRYHGKKSGALPVPFHPVRGWSVQFYHTRWNRSLQDEKFHTSVEPSFIGNTVQPPQEKWSMARAFSPYKVLFRLVFTHEIEQVLTG